MSQAKVLAKDAAYIPCRVDPVADIITLSMMLEHAEDRAAQAGSVADRQTWQLVAAEIHATPTLDVLVRKMRNAVSCLSGGAVRRAYQELLTEHTLKSPLPRVDDCTLHCSSGAVPHGAACFDDSSEY